MRKPTELPDLDRLEALARAATPGEWNAQRHGCVVGGPMRKYVNGSAQAQLASFNVTFHDQDPDDELERQQANAEFCAAANPAAVLALITLARRAQPEGEAPQAEPVLPEGFTLAPVQMPEKMRTYLQDRLHHPICKAEIVWKQLLKMGLDMEDE